MDQPTVDPLQSVSKELALAGFDDVKSSLGPQYESTKTSAPASSFGVSTRPDLQPQGHDVPGPGQYSVGSTLGGSFVSKQKSAAAFSIRGREKFGSIADTKASSSLPGPGSYNSKVVNPQERTAPKVTIGKKWKQKQDYERTPGPGQYSSYSGVSKQPLSTKKNTAVPKFGTSKRPPLLQASSADIGPGDYKVPITAAGPQKISTKKSSAAYSFSVAGRKNAPIGSRMSHDVVPGPGSYKRYNALGKQTMSTYKSAPSCTMSGREKFGSHY